MSSLTRFTVRITAFLMATSLVWLGSEPAFAIGCGETIYADTVLDSNLHCTGNGIIIGASGITLRLHGFIIDGTGSGVGIRIGWYGNGYENVTVKGPGVVREFDEGIQIIEGSGHKILGVTVAHNNQRGILASYSSDNEIKENVAYGNGVGIQVSLPRGNLPNQVLNNETHSNTTGILLQGNENGILLEGNGTIAKGNYSHTNGSWGIWVYGDDNVVAENKISQNYTGIAVGSGGDGNLVKKNDITNNTATGVISQFTSNTEISKNVIADHYTGVHIYNDTNAAVAENTLSANDRQIVDENSTGTVVEDNICDPPNADPECF